jgi:LCP family protein required for cell wall assembly
LPGARFPESPVLIQRQSVGLPGQIKILLLGADLRSTNNSYRTDSIVLLVLNTHQGSASLLSIPPALYVNIPEVGMERINSAVTFGGAGKVMDTLQYNLGLRPEKYLIVDMNNFTRIIEFLGELDVNAPSPITDRCDLLQAVDGWCTINAGMNHMDKDTALWYIRSINGGEFHRLLRTQQVLLAVFTKLMALNADSRIEELYATFYESVETDFSIDDFRYLASLAKLLQNPDRIHRYSFTAREAVPFTLPGGENVLLLDQNAAWDLINFAVLVP